VVTLLLGNSKTNLPSGYWVSSVGSSPQLNPALRGLCVCSPLTTKVTAPDSNPLQERRNETTTQAQYQPDVALRGIPTHPLISERNWSTIPSSEPLGIDNLDLVPIRSHRRALCVPQQDAAPHRPPHWRVTDQGAFLLTREGWRLFSSSCSTAAACTAQPGPLASPMTFLALLACLTIAASGRGGRHSREEDHGTSCVETRGMGETRNEGNRNSPPGPLPILDHS